MVVAPRDRAVSRSRCALTNRELAVLYSLVYEVLWGWAGTAAFPDSAREESV